MRRNKKEDLFVASICKNRWQKEHSNTLYTENRFLDGLVNIDLNLNINENIVEPANNENVDADAILIAEAIRNEQVNKIVIVDAIPNVNAVPKYGDVILPPKQRKRKQAPTRNNPKRKCKTYTNN